MSRATPSKGAAPGDGAAEATAIAAAEAAALADVDVDALADELAALVRVPSLTGHEAAVLDRLAALGRRAGLAVDRHDHDLAALRAHPGHPGEEAPRDRLPGLTVTLPAHRSSRRLCLNGHVDVVPPGTVPWRYGPWSGTVHDGFVHGRGAVDMKGGVAAALHAMRAVAVAAPTVPRPEVVLQAVPSEEDGGLGTFAALERDGRFDAAMIPEPTGFAVACAQAGALTFAGTVRGRSAHAALRLAGESAIDRYVEIHRALQEHERRLNADVAHPLMRELELPYPLSVGRVAGGDWSSQVPDRVTFEGRVGVRVGESLDAARGAFEAAAAGAEIEWAGGAFAPAETATDERVVRLACAAVEDERGRPAACVGVPWGADMRLFCARGIPCTMVGPGGFERAHGVDERVRVDDLAALARILVRVIVRFADDDPASPSV